jgi:hypothetical protein
VTDVNQHLQTGFYRRVTGNTSKADHNLDDLWTDIIPRNNEFEKGEYLLCLFPLPQNDPNRKEYLKVIHLAETLGLTHPDKIILSFSPM